ncbi:MAG: hypothetical protein KIH69_020740, partial [Anaerolineae bacterium]|nr:hypothetical protein [Anaerolineae bacterium]
DVYKRQKQHIANIEAELANTRRELNAAKDTLRKLEQIIGKSDLASTSGEVAVPRPASRIIEPIPPNTAGDAAPTPRPPAAKRRCRLPRSGCAISPTNCSSVSGLMKMRKRN